MGGLTKHALAETREFLVEDVSCRSRPSGWSDLEESHAYGLIFVRSGCFHRRVNGVDMFADPTVVYFERPGDEQQISHPVAGDSCTAVYLCESLLAQVRGGDPNLPDRPLATDAALDMRQRLLLTLIAGESDAEDIVEAVVSLAADVLERSSPRHVASGRPATALARRRVVDTAREALAERPAAGVLELAAFAAVSPHHLSRVFKAETGEPISRYRNRLRVRLALERIAQGESCLARIAADLGFSDQGHLSRVVRQEVGETPSRLRARLDPAARPRRRR